MGSHLITLDDLHEVVEALALALDAKNSCMCGHSERVAELALLLAAELGFSPEEQMKIHIGAHLHDIGKIGIPDNILNKEGKLTKEEFDLIREHPVIGDSIVGRIQAFRSIADSVRYHHERYDGKGYPDGLQGEEIPIEARIVAVADSFDAMTTVRTYRRAVSLKEALAEIVRCRSTQFDPVVVDALLQLAAENKLYSMCYERNTKIAVTG
ncbi:HD-GYP domain-containing protein [Propionispora hippei]|uniref:HDIG domain-containing protein n=1 Tax=Propionispora hippei DSM 15287 TaxID=1123003 RepID=A0A1M6M3S4_9FIRM|nr:HD-GYP domain-containing protein [Propionispora hippei]SHJ78109.1 HDIG domain-containing protein [Propionispora hippei DSM 15287]